MKKAVQISMALMVMISCLFTGCHSEDMMDDTDSQMEAAVSIPEHAEEIALAGDPLPASELFDPISGTDSYGKTITIGLTSTPTLDWDPFYSYKSSKHYQFQNGYAIPCIGPTGSFDVYIDRYGHVIGQNLNIQQGEPFTENGLALIRREDNTWEYMDTTGQVIGPASEEEVEAFMDAEGQTSEDIFPVAAVERYFTIDFDSSPLYALVDENHTFLTGPIFSTHSDFVGEFCYATLAEGEHRNVLLNANGEICAVLPDDCTGVEIQSEDLVICKVGSYRQLYDTTGHLLSEIQFDTFSYFYNGLALAIADHKIGVIDDHGKVVIPPVIPYDEDEEEKYDPDFMDEDLAIIPYHNKLAILEILRS